MRAADCKKLAEKPEWVFRQALPQSLKRGLRLFHSLQLEFGCDIIGKTEEKETKHMDHGAYAAELFCKGYNCAQAVTVAFCDVTGLSEDFSASFLQSAARIVYSPQANKFHILWSNCHWQLFN